jgi:hypothetical protein
MAIKSSDTLEEEEEEEKKKTGADARKNYRQNREKKRHS